MVDVIDDLARGSLANLGRRPGADRSRVDDPPPRHPRRPEVTPRTSVTSPRSSTTWRRRSMCVCRWQIPPSTPRSTCWAPERAGGRAAGRAPARSSLRRAAARSTATPDAVATCRSRRAHPLRPLSPYGMAKNVVTDYLSAYRRASTSSSSRRSPWPTCTAHDRTRTVRRGSCRSSLGGCWLASPARSSATEHRHRDACSWTTWSTRSCGPGRR